MNDLKRIGGWVKNGKQTDLSRPAKPETLPGIRSRRREADLMSIMKSFYNVTYGRFRAPWGIGPRKELEEIMS